MQDGTTCMISVDAELALQREWDWAMGVDLQDLPVCNVSEELRAAEH